MSKNNATPAPEVYSLATAPEHPLAKKYGITTRQFRRAIETKRISYAKPGGLIVRFTYEDIENFILGSRTDATR